ncbi:DUF5047 domain-containing protein [Paractinoplanes hotanensis]|uniref:DUF5047 domain-containing protein n=1 Tax=Paractinoplanes hotanensis TaxID=2906497 RepID=A0ABT0Y3J0_9ACTN|nr:DUF5047 domain-containing protein [Actinoplanes hotanensis]MCM4080405.1 DUF5047 domain-containing protein [Actinoplanes hotanensis]
MRPVSDRFLAALRGSHRAVSQAFVVAPGQTGTSPTGTEIEILSGDVRFDAKAQVRGTLTLETSGADGFPQSATDALTPYGNEIFVRRGLDYGGGAIEWVSLGYYRIQSVEQDEAPFGPIRITGADRMQGIVDGRLSSPTQFGATQEYGTVLESMVWPVWGWADIEWDDDTDDEQIGRAVLAEEDRYAFLNELITSLGKVWYWDYRGVLVIKDAPTVVEPVWTCNEGADGVLVQLSRDLSREGVYNAVVATGETLDDTAPARGVVVDDDPASPTYWEGSFGRVPRYYSSPFLLTDAQAVSAATSILRQSLGVPFAVDFQSIVNPALTVGDAVTIVLGGEERVHVIDELTIPLSPAQAMTAITREQPFGEVGEL